jgi:hypothetical protein
VGAWRSASVSRPLVGELRQAERQTQITAPRRIQKWLPHVVASSEGASVAAPSGPRSRVQRRACPGMRLTQSTSPQRQGHPRNTHFGCSTGPTATNSPARRCGATASVDSAVGPSLTRRTLRAHFHHRIRMFTRRFYHGRWPFALPWQGGVPQPARCLALRSARASMILKIAFRS